MTLSTYMKTDDQGKEKHVPHIEVEDCDGCSGLCVTVSVGKEVMHPSTAEHSIKTITLYGVTKEGKLEQLVNAQLGDENTVPVVSTGIVKEKYVELIAVSYCNLHGLWENKLTF